MSWNEYFSTQTKGLYFDIIINFSMFKFNYVLLDTLYNNYRYTSLISDNCYFIHLHKCIKVHHQYRSDKSLPGSFLIPCNSKLIYRCVSNLVFTQSKCDIF